MKINNIILHNFGSYEGTTPFETKPFEDRNIVLIGGKNGAGKTTLFTAIRVCLYGYKSMGYKNLNSFYIKSIIKLINNTAKITRPVISFVKLSVNINNGQGEDCFELTRKWELEESLIETFSIQKNGFSLNEEEIADFEKYIISLIPPELFNLYFFDGEKIADFFLDEGGSSRIKDAFLTLCGYDTFDIMRKNFKRISTDVAASSTTLNEYWEINEKVLSNETTYSDLTSKLALCIDSIADLESTLDSLEKEYYQKGGTTEEELKKKVSSLKEETKKRETFNSLLRKWANDVVPFIMLEKQINELKGQIERENSGLKYTYFCEVINTKKIKSLIRDKVKEIEKEAFSLFGSKEKPILNLSIEQSSVLLNQINSILSFEKEKISKCKKAIKQSLNLSNKLRKEIDSSNITSVKEYMKKRAELFEEKSTLLVQRVELEKQIVEQKEILDELKQSLSSTKARLESDLKSKSINDISARAIVMLDKLQTTLYNKQISRVEDYFRKEINLLMRKKHFIDDIHIDERFNTHIYRTDDLSKEKLLDALFSNTENQLSILWGNKAIKKLYSLSKADTYLDAINYFKTKTFTNISLPIEIDKSSLSNGEKQIFIMALYHSLIQLCNHNLPFVIDTPFARIDKEHRNNISKNFFSKLNGQIFILSTDEEINNYHVKMLEKKIAATYMLENKDDKRTVVIQNSYFGA